MLSGPSHGTGSFDDEYPSRADWLSEVLVAFLGDASITDREPDDRLVAVSVAIVHVDVTVDNREHFYAVVTCQTYGWSVQCKRTVVDPLNSARSSAAHARSPVNSEARTNRTPFPSGDQAKAVGYHGQPTVNRKLFRCGTQRQ